MFFNQFQQQQKLWEHFGIKVWSQDLVAIHIPFSKRTTNPMTALTLQKSNYDCKTLGRDVFVCEIISMKNQLLHLH